VRHAILGTGGVGGLIGGALARSGADVVLLMRPETLERYGGRLRIESAVLGDFEVECPAATELEREVDALWVTTKATQLEAALELAPPDRVVDATVVPLLNGIDHIRLLRSRYRHVVAGAMRVESERVAPGVISQRSPFIRVELAGAEPLAEELRAAGIECTVRDDELTLLWSKLAFLAPMALATTALDGPLGAVRGDARYLRAQEEALTVARAEGAQVDEEGLRKLSATALDTMQSSMQKDVAAGRPPELDAIGGAVLRAAARHGIAAPGTEELVDLVAQAARSRRKSSST
jgi:2-dehydropantoate 2-reductase